MKKMTPDKILHTYIKENKIDSLARMLDEKGADINSRNHKGGTIFHSFVEHNSFFNHHDEELRTFDFILSRGADINAYDKNGRTPLMYYLFSWGIASNDWQAGDLHYFIEHGAQLNQFDNDGKNELMHLLNGYSEITAGSYDLKYLRSSLEVLLKAGADPWLKNKDGISAFDYAATLKTTIALQVLEQVTKKMNSTLPGKTEVIDSDELVLMAESIDEQLHTQYVIHFDGFWLVSPAFYLGVVNFMVVPFRELVEKHAYFSKIADMPIGYMATISQTEIDAFNSIEKLSEVIVPSIALPKEKIIPVEESVHDVKICYGELKLDNDYYQDNSFVVELLYNNERIQMSEYYSYSYVTNAEADEYKHYRHGAAGICSVELVTDDIHLTKCHNAELEGVYCLFNERDEYGLGVPLSDYFRYYIIIDIKRKKGLLLRERSYDKSS